MNRLLEVWRELLDRNDLPDGISRRRLTTTPPTDAFAAIRMPEHQAVLMIGIDDDSARRFPDFETEALSARVGHVGERPVVQLELIGIEYLDVFATLAIDLLGGIDGRDAAEATSIVANRLHRWHELLNRRRRGLSIEEQRGLVGELAVLRQLLEAGPSASVDLVRAWRGPFGNLHDFVLPHGAIEVKAHGKGKALRINGVDQLWPPDPGSRLLLAAIQTDSSADGVPLAEHIRLTRAALDGEPVEAQELLEHHLATGGWSDEQAARYPTPWNVDLPELFEVTDGFPRLDPAAIPAGVTVTSYSLAKSAAADFKVGGGAVETLLVESSAPNTEPSHG